MYYVCLGVLGCIKGVAALRRIPQPVQPGTVSGPKLVLAEFGHSQEQEAHLVVLMNYHLINVTNHEYIRLSNRILDCVTYEG